MVKRKVVFKPKNQGLTTVWNILEDAREQDLKARKEGRKPKGWILGEAIISAIENEFESPYITKDPKTTFNGLPYFKDTKNKERLELIV